MLLIQEPLLGETLPAQNMQESIDEAYETLSLCDLPLYSDHSVEEYRDEDLSTESHGSSYTSSSEQDYFEFFSPELSPPTSNFPPENIVFCGKLIPYKQLVTTSKVDESSKKQTNIKKSHSWDIFQLKFSSIKRSKRQIQSKNGKKSRTLMDKKDDHVPKKMHNSNQEGKWYDFPVHKVSMLTSSSSGKARWYLLLFGISRFSTEMELRDVKSRLSRRHGGPSPPPTPPPSLRRHGGSGLWGLIRILSCGGNHHPNTMVAASTTCSPRE